MKQILNIFSKSKLEQKPEQELKITADYREKNSLVISELISLGIRVDFRELKVADYIAKDVAVERKTVSDFISSMLSGRMIKQLESLQVYNNRLLIIEGVDEQELYSDEDSEEKTGVHPNSIRGFLLSILLKYKVPVIFTKNYKDTARFISVILRKKARELPLNVSRKAHNKKEQLQIILEGFPGIGPKTAKKLLEKFKTIKEIINTPLEQLTEIIGKKADIFKIVGEVY